MINSNACLTNKVCNLETKISQFYNESLLRTYYPNYSVLNQKWLTALSAIDIASMGFTAVGGASIVDNGSLFGSPAYRMLRLTATRPLMSISANTVYSIPTQYVRHDVLITPNVDNQYMLQVVTGGAAREVTVETWLCDPISNLPVKRLYGNSVPEPNDTNSTDTASVQRDPDNGSAYEDYYRYWLSFNIPTHLVNSYRTPSNILKIAIRPSADNGQINFFYISGYAMCEAKYSLMHMAMMTFENTANIGTFRIAGNGGNYPIWSAEYAGYGHSYIPPNQSRIFDIPIVNSSKDIYLTVLGLLRNATDSEALGVTKSIFEIVHPSGNLILGRPRLDVYAPSTNIIKWGYQAVGFIIPANVLLTKASDINSNSAFKYLRIKINVPNIGYNANIGAFITESV